MKQIKISALGLNMKEIEDLLGSVSSLAEGKAGKLAVGLLSKLTSSSTTAATLKAGLESRTSSLLPGNKSLSVEGVLDSMEEGGPFLTSDTLSSSLLAGVPVPSVMQEVGEESVLKLVPGKVEKSIEELSKEGGAISKSGAAVMSLLPGREHIKANWVSEASPTLGCSIEISRDILYICMSSIVYGKTIQKNCMLKCVGGNT